MKTYDVFRSENRANGRSDHIGEVEAIDSDNAIVEAQARFECSSIYSLTVEERSVCCAYCDQEHSQDDEKIIPAVSDNTEWQRRSIPRTANGLQPEHIAGRQFTICNRAPMADSPQL